MRLRRCRVPAWQRHWPAKLLLLLMLCSAPLAQAATILAFGDSISAAYGLEVKQGWVSLLRQRLDKMAPGQHLVINGSLSGETTAGGKSRLPPLLAQHHPDLVILELGGNDGLRGLSPRDIQANLEKMVGEARAAGAKVLLLGVKIPPNYGPVYARAFEQAFTKAGKEAKVPLLPFFMSNGKGGVVPLQADDIHPTAEAQPQLLANAWPMIEKLLKQVK